MQPRVHESKPRRGCDRFDQLRLLPQRRVVDEDGERLSVVLDQGDRTIGAILRNGALNTRRVDVDAPVRNPETELQRRILESERDLVAEAVDRRLLEMDHELPDVHARKARPEETPEQCQRQRRQRDDLPPEEVVDDRGRLRVKREDPVEHGPQRGRDGGDEERQVQAPSAWCRSHELPQYEEDEQRAEHGVGDDTERVLQ